VTEKRTNSDLTIEGIRHGAAFDAVLPNLGTAGYRWQADFDPQDFEVISVDRTPMPPHKVVFRFRAIGASGDITFNLARAGRPIEQTRIYRVIVVEP
jgi:hypothetical protein